MPPKTEAGRRSIPMLPALRRALLTWKIKSPYTTPTDYIVCAVGGVPVMERNLRRALDAAKTGAGIDGGEERLSWHSLRHSYSFAAPDRPGSPSHDSGPRDRALGRRVHAPGVREGRTRRGCHGD